jgi:peptidoglycan/LPS O-acetylase OafA/YrhL
MRSTAVRAKSDGQPRTVRDNQAINALRSLAAVAVVVGHVRTLYFQDYAVVPHSVAVQVGYAATLYGHGSVMVFFVLSGFWVGGAVLAKTRDGRFRVGAYARDRLVRLWLVLLPALALTAVLDLTGRWWFPSSSIYSGDPGFHNVVPVSPGSTMSVATALGNAAFLQHAWVPPLGTDTPLWSLAYEFWYYALFPCMVLLLRRSTSTPVRVVSAAVLVAGGLVSGPAVLQLFPVWLLGVLVAARQETIRRLLSSGPRPLLAAVRMAVVVAFVVTVVGLSLSRTASRAADLAVGVTTAGLLALLVDDVRWRGAPDRMLRTLSRLAHGSYSLYAIHLPILAFVAAAVIGRADRRWFPDLLHLGAAALVFMVVALAAWGFASCTEARTHQVRSALRRMGSNQTPTSSSR